METNLRKLVGIFLPGFFLKILNKCFTMVCINSRLCIWCASDPSSIHPETLRVCEATFCFCHKNLSLLEMPLTIFFSLLLF